MNYFALLSWKPRFGQGMTAEEVDNTMMAAFAGWTWQIKYARCYKIECSAAGYRILKTAIKQAHLTCNGAVSLVCTRHHKRNGIRPTVYA